MAITEKKIEDMLSKVMFTDSAHKEALRQRLYSETAELGSDELDMVAGGIMICSFSNMTDEWDKL